MQRTLSSLASASALFALVVLAGCSAGSPVAAGSEDSSFDASDYKLIALAEPDISNITTQGSVQKHRVAEWLTAAMLRYAEPVRTGFSSDPAEDEADAVLELTVAAFDGGRADLRFLFALVPIPAGRASVHVEGRLLDAKTNAVLATFSETANSGLGGYKEIRKGGDATGEYLQEMLAKVATNIGDSLVDLGL